MGYDINESREKKVKRIPKFEPDRTNWPNSIREISVDDFGMMAVDAQGRLHWDGREIELKRLTLSFWQKLATFAIAVSALVVAINIIWQWLCVLGWVLIGPACITPASFPSLSG